MIKLAPAALFATSLGLAAIVAEEVVGFAPPQAPAARRAQAVPPSVGAESTPDHTPEWVETILARPLFSPDRRPPAGTTAAAAHAPQGLPRLSGIVVGPFGRSAIFVPDGGKALVVAEGSRVDAWTVQKIDEDAVRISGPGGTRTIEPTFQTLPPTGQRKALSPPR